MVMHPTCNIWSMVMLMQTKVWLSPSKPASSVSSTSSPLSIRTLGKTHTHKHWDWGSVHTDTQALRQRTHRHWKKLIISSVWVWACRQTHRNMSKHLWTLRLLACQVRVTTGDSDLCYCVYVMFFKCYLTPLVSWFYATQIKWFQANKEFKCT